MSTLATQARLPQNSTSAFERELVTSLERTLREQAEALNALSAGLLAGVRTASSAPTWSATPGDVVRHNEAYMGTNVDGSKYVVYGWIYTVNAGWKQLRLPTL